MKNNDIKELTDFLDKYGIEYEVVGDSVIAEKVDLANRSISKLPESIGNLKGEVLWLAHNKLTSLPDSFGDIKYKELGLQYNNLTSLPNSIVNLKCDILYLYDNPLRSSKSQHLLDRLKRNGVIVIYL